MTRRQAAAAAIRSAQLSLGTTSTGRLAWCTIALETPPSTTEPTVERPRAPATISWLDTATLAVAVLLKKVLAAYSIRTTNNGQRATGQPWQGMGGDGLPVFREHQLGDARPKLFVRMAQLDGANDGAGFARCFCHHNPGWYGLDDRANDGRDRSLPTARLPDHAAF